MDRILSKNTHRFLTKVYGMLVRPDLIGRVISGVTYDQRKGR